MKQNWQEMQDELNHEQRLLNVYIQRLRPLEIQAAKVGLNTPPEISNEIDEYLSVIVEPSNINPCDWWKHHQLQYPVLSKIAKNYICIPATSVPSEQAFSKSGELINIRRNRLGDSSIEACMCLNSWLKLENN